MNMPHCRFENTLRDLKDCVRNMNNIDDDNMDEKEAKEELIKLCKEIAEQN